MFFSYVRPSLPQHQQQDVGFNLRPFKRRKEMRQTISVTSLARLTSNNFTTAIFQKYVNESTIETKTVTPHISMHKFFCKSTVTTRSH